MKKILIILVCFITVTLTGCTDKEPEFVIPDGANTITVEFRYFDREYEADRYHEIVKINKGDTVNTPEVPTYYDYFEGWYLDGEIFDFSTKLNEDTVIVAKFSEIVGTITYNDLIYTCYENGQAAVSMSKKLQSYEIEPKISCNGKSYNVSRISNDGFTRGYLKNFIIPSHIESIGARAFELSYYLETITIPDSVKIIEEDAFKECDELTNLYIPSSVVEIWGNPFAGCMSLKSILVSNSNIKYKSVDNVLYTKDGNKLVAYPNMKAKTFTVPPTVSIIGEESFYTCNNLTNITITDSVTVIETRAFVKSENLQTAYLSRNLKRIEEEAFRLCYVLEDVNLPNGLNFIGDYAFSRCTAFETVTIPESITEINHGTFSYISAKSVIIPKTVNKIAHSSFWSCPNLEEFIVDEDNESYHSIDGVIFQTDENILMVYPQKKAETRYTIPEGVTKILRSAFSNCTNLTYLYIPLSVTHIEEFTVTGCTNLTIYTPYESAPWGWNSSWLRDSEIVYGYKD